jgi:hypothetical protein
MILKIGRGPCLNKKKCGNYPDQNNPKTGEDSDGETILEFYVRQDWQPF